MTEQGIDAETTAFIADVVSQSAQEIYFRSWVQFRHAEKDPAKSRILCVASFRFYVIRSNAWGKKVLQSHNILSLTRITVVAEDTVEFILGGTTFLVESPRTQYIVHCVRFAYQSLTFGRPVDLCAQFFAPDDFFTKYLPPEPDAEDGLLAGYLAHSDRADVLKSRLLVLDYLVGCFDDGDRVLDLGSCLSFVDTGNYGPDCNALCQALKDSMYFDAIVAESVALKNEGLQEVVAVLGQPTKIRKLVLRGCKANKQCVAEIVRQLNLGFHQLEFLCLSGNAIEGRGAAQILDALAVSITPLTFLSLNNCGIATKDTKRVTKSLSEPEWMLSLRVLELSGNKLGKSGSKALAEWFQRELALEEVHLRSCDLALDIILEGLAKNITLIENSLRSINISGNKFTKKTTKTVCQLVRDAKSLTRFGLSNVGIRNKDAAAMIGSLLTNKHQPLRLALDLSHNDLGPKAATGIANIWKEAFFKNKHHRLRQLDTLILNNNKLGPDGFIAICAALEASGIRCLGLACTVKLGMFGSGKGIGEAVARLAMRTTSLIELDLHGSKDCYLRDDTLNPLFIALRTPAVSLRSLNVARNRLGDERLQFLAETVASNSTLTALNVERNRMAASGLGAILTACASSNVMDNFCIPMYDILSTLTKSPQQAQVIQQLVNSIETKEGYGSAPSFPLSYAFRSYEDRERMERFKSRRENTAKIRTLMSLKGTNAWATLVSGQTQDLDEENEEEEEE